MVDLSKLGQPFVYMKVGTHANEPLKEIIERKTREIERAGYAMWGYGGNTCHPLTMMRPFAKSYEQRGGIIYLCMEEMNSNNFADQIRAEQYSIDQSTWQDIHPDVNVLGSRFALVIKNLRQEEFDVSLDSTRVALGRSAGMIGSKYIAGRVDKGCLEVFKDPGDRPGNTKHIRLVADIVDPYAVLLRNKS